jgi:hypothetical protein
MPVHAAATQRQRSCWIAIEPPSFFSFLCTCTKYNNSSERTSNPVLKSKTTRPLPCQNAVMRPSRIFGSLTPSREGSRLTSTHLHAGFTRESDVRRESDVKRNIASRVRAHASRFFRRESKMTRESKTRFTRGGSRLTVKAATLPK